MGITGILCFASMGSCLERIGTLVFCKKQTKILVYSDACVKYSWDSAYNLSFHILQDTIFKRA